MCLSSLKSKGSPAISRGADSSIIAPAGCASGMKD
jgi:hypothetical protein